MQENNFKSQFFYDRLLQELNIKRDIELANMLGVSQPTVSGWRKRDSVDLPLLVSKLEGMKLDWNYIISGKRASAKNISLVVDGAEVYHNSAAILDQPTAG